MKQTCWLIIFTFSMASTSCLDQGVEQRWIKRVLSKDSGLTASCYTKFRKLGRQAIPQLIQVIDTDEKGVAGFKDITSALMLSGHINSYVGMRAAYLIDFIVSNSKTARIYHEGIIVAGSKKSLSLLYLDDMKTIKAKYQQWWVDNKIKSDAELERQWNLNNGALSDGKYFWR